MSQNRSTAVMQRRVEAHDSLDDFPTPPWATRERESADLTVFSIRCHQFWLKSESGRGTHFEWIPQCRKRLEKPGDAE